uniref:Uncharacterized protein n=1 Tax=Nelumbo nucifera TaxID=4432 RepID=A0A822YMB2_NELNU|nr:TPA_asm: hypothetical protein HUJ06_012074 [Nelumbo nucifera]
MISKTTVVSIIILDSVLPLFEGREQFLTPKIKREKYVFGCTYDEVFNLLFIFYF